MRRILTFISATFITGSLLAGGLVTNTNQSASWVRLPARDASTSIDAVYYNPAGLMKLDNGFHFSISNQVIHQNKEVHNYYTGPGGAFGLNDGLYKGKVSAPVFPGVYAAYKMDKLAFSFGFNPVGGGGGAKFDRGLPSFEMSASDLVPALVSKGASGYRVNTYFEGTSVYYGFQGGVSYKINDFISVAGGVRVVSAKNTYQGYLKDIEISLPTGWTRADVIMNGISAQATTAAGSTTALVTAGAGALTLAQAEQATIITTQQRLALEGALAAFGSPTTITIAQADAVFKGAAAKYAATASLLGDQEADVTQTGTGYTPFLSVNISPLENLNIAVKYEFATKIELTNKTKKDITTDYTEGGVPVTMFPNGEKVRNDMPAMLSLGVDYGVTSKLNVTAGVHYFFDKSANYGHKVNDVYVPNSAIIDKNYYELAAGLQYKINDMFLVSGGYLYSRPGVKADFQSDLTYELPASTVGAGGAVNILKNLQVNLGFAYTFYDKGEKIVYHLFSPTQTSIPARETYFIDTMVIAAGVDFSF
ncbi:MAG: hypothetical protein Q8868_08385 [Bacteroidota bacterium]|nr:hypothetical protein [Bacteroidota bacterium]